MKNKDNPDVCFTKIIDSFHILIFFFSKAPSYVLYIRNSESRNLTYGSPILFASLTIPKSLIQPLSSIGTCLRKLVLLQLKAKFGTADHKKASGHSHAY